LYIDIGGRAPDLGRQPRAAARLIERHVDRVLFGSDLLPIAAAGYGIYFRLLETDDEYFPYTTDGKAPPQGRWHISGLGLGHESLERLYAENARRLLGLG
jgi:predicted TIM-barrel fold metal-dependent hydrolase